MFYHNLYSQYVKDLRNLKVYIKHLKSSAKTEEERENIKWRVSILYSMYLDMKHTCEYLNLRCRGKTSEN